MGRKCVVVESSNDPKEAVPVTVGPLWLLLFLLFSCSVSDCNAVIVGSAVLPHGDFVFDPSLVDFANGSLELHNAALSVGAAIADKSADLLVLITPHGVEIGEDIAVYANTNASGFADLGQDLHNATHPRYRVPLQVELAPSATQSIVDELRGLGHRITLMKSFADSEPQAIRWGEVIPLSFLPTLNSTTSKHSAPKIIILSLPLARYNRSDVMIPSLLSLGADLGKILEGSPLRSVVLASGDLAHTHLASGPYGFSPNAEPFDEAVTAWGATLDTSSLTVTAAHLVQDAKSCGFTGFVLLHGALCSVIPPSTTRLRGVRSPRRSSHGGDCACWKSGSVPVTFHPTYYGMMVAQFVRVCS